MSERELENVVLLRRLDNWQDGEAAGPLIRWAAAHLRGCIDKGGDPETARTHKGDAMTTISVNGRDVETAAESLTGAELVALAGKHPGCTVTVHYRREDDKRGRAPVPDEAVDVRPGMMVSVADTGADVTHAR